MLRGGIGVCNTCITEVYVEILHSTDCRTPIKKVPTQTQGNMNTLYDQKSSDAEDLFRRRLLHPQMYKRCAKPPPAGGISAMKEPPAKYQEIRVHGYQIHVKGDVPNTGTWYCDRSKQIKGGDRVGTAVHHHCSGAGSTSVLRNIFPWVWCPSYVHRTQQ